MSITDILFYLFGAMTLSCGFLVVANPLSRNPVTSAMFLVLTIISLAGLYVLLNAFFLAAVQILVYAGAVMVLFLFVIMMLNVQEEERRRYKLYGLVLGILSVAGLASLMVCSVMRGGIGAAGKPELIGDTVGLGKSLFSSGTFLLPFEIVSLLLLVAMVGVILLSKKEVK